MSKYNNALNILQAYPIVKIGVSDPFPLVNTTIQLTNESSDDDTFLWTINDGTNITNDSVNRTYDLSLIDFGDLQQTLEISNTVATINTVKYVYPLPIPEEAYYTFDLSTTVSRVGEEVTITLNNIFNYAGAHSVVVVITDHYTGAVEQTINAGLVETFTINTLGVYDIEVQATTGAYTVYNKQGMILTVTNALSLREDALVHNLQPTSVSNDFYGVPWSIIDGVNYNYEGQPIAPGTTIVLEKDVTYPSDSIYRLRLQNLQGTPEDPIIITIDEASTFDFGFESYWGIFIENCKHIIIDGRGYQNLEKGLNIFTNESAENKGIISIQGSIFSTDVEIHNVECHEVEFAGIMFKTDPDKDDPSTWRPTVEGGEGFECNNLKIHNTYMHNTEGEGYYLGYFDAGVFTKLNSLGESVTYRAHKLINTKLYRNEFYRCGWDSLQLNNAYGATEIAYNYLKDSAWTGEVNQNTGMSLSLEGEIHDNIIDGCPGNGIQFLPLSETSIYNNLIFNISSGSNVLYLLGGEGRVPEVNPEGSGENNVVINIYNNNLIAEGRGNILGAQNVVQYLGVLIRNNIQQYLEGSYVGGQDTSTMSLWQANASNNINLTNEDPLTNKIANREDGNYNIYMNSDLREGGLLLGNQYDIRGFKNWSDTEKFYGCYASYIKIQPDYRPIELLTFELEGGDEFTSKEVVTGNITYIGTPTMYMTSEDPTFTGASWVTFTGSISHTLSTGIGVKTVYCKIKDVVNTESVTLNDSIEVIVSSIIVSLANAGTYEQSDYVIDNNKTVNSLSYAQDETKENFLIKNSSGSDSGYFVVKPSEYPVITGIKPMFTIGTNDAILSGDTGEYSDALINKMYTPQDGHVLGNVGVVKFAGIPENEYEIRILKSSNTNTYSSDNLPFIRIQANDTFPVNPVVDIENNATAWTTIKGVLVDASGDLILSFFNDKANIYHSPGVNIIEITPKVLDRSIQTYLIDLSSIYSGRVTPAPYNSFIVDGNAPVPISSALALGTTDNQDNGVQLVVTSSNWTITDNGVQSSPIYETSAVRDAFTIQSGETGTFELTGCNPLKNYTIRILHNRAYVDSFTDTTVQGVLKSINAKNNESVLEWTNVTAVSDVITISVFTASETTNVNVIEIIES